jgi:NAD(P)-dependent dehydrogenase (short-subunit alcohol dehydrogenase family)
MRRILVTGANKGIGLAITTAILSEHEDTLVFLGSRDQERGEAARRGLIGAHPAFADRVVVVSLDVTSDARVEAVTTRIRECCPGEATPLYGLVNNAGIGGKAALKDTFAVNTLGVRRVCQAFAPLLAPGVGRIVNLTSAAGPSYVATCSEARRRFFVDPDIEWSALEALLQECLAIAGNREEFARRGLGDGSPYGLSKACANSYTLLLARQWPTLHVNACTPGFIETDMTRHYAASQGKTAAELGLRPAKDGARTPLYLLFGELEGNGRYYGSDAQRSPFDRYRSPGSEPYRGD